MAPAPVPTGRRARRTRAGALACLALALAGCGSAARDGAATTAVTTPADRAAVPTAKPAAPKQPRSHKAKRHKPLAQAPDPLTAGRTSGIAEGAPSDAEVRRQLAQAMGYKHGATASTKSLVNTALLTPDGLVTSPPSAPIAVQAMINGANQVAHLPYVYGGGHTGHWEDSAYDCSGSVSFALAAAGFLKTQLDSTALSHWGVAGPGHWVTIYANASHAFMVVAGVRFDTSGRGSQRGSRWQGEMRSTAGFVARHPKGL